MVEKEITLKLKVDYDEKALEKLLDEMVALYKEQNNIMKVIEYANKLGVFADGIEKIYSYYNELEMKKADLIKELFMNIKSIKSIDIK